MNDWNMIIDLNFRAALAKQNYVCKNSQCDNKIAYDDKSYYILDNDRNEVYCKQCGTQIEKERLNDESL